MLKSLINVIAIVFIIFGAIDGLSSSIDFVTTSVFFWVVSFTIIVHVLLLVFKSKLKKIDIINELVNSRKHHVLFVSIIMAFSIAYLLNDDEGSDDRNQEMNSYVEQLNNGNTVSQYCYNLKENDDIEYAKNIARSKAIQASIESSKIRVRSAVTNIQRTRDSLGQQTVDNLYETVLNMVADSYIEKSETKFVSTKSKICFSINGKLTDGDIYEITRDVASGMPAIGSKIEDFEKFKYISMSLGIEIPRALPKDSYYLALLIVSSASTSLADKKEFINSLGQYKETTYNKLFYLFEAEAYTQAINYTENGRFDEAINLLQLLANHGHLEAMRKLGGFYENGIGVNVNLPAAEKWYRVSNYDIGLERIGVVKSENFLIPKNLRYVVNHQSTLDEILGDKLLTSSINFSDNAGQLRIRDENGILTIEGRMDGEYVGFDNKLQPENGDSSDYIMIEGIIEKVEKRKFTMNGIIEHRSTMLAHGFGADRPCRMIGRFTFRKYPNKNFYRLKEKESPCIIFEMNDFFEDQPLVVYVDILI